MGFSGSRYEVKTVLNSRNTSNTPNLQADFAGVTNINIILITDLQYFSYHELSNKTLILHFTK